MPDAQGPEGKDEDLEALPAGTRARSASVILSAIVLLLIIVWLLSGGGAEFFSPQMETHTFLSDSGGLEKDAEVLVNGVPVGKVHSVHLSNSHDPNRAIQVDIRIERRFAGRIPVDSIAALTADNLLGDKFINITLGTARQSISDGAEIASLVQSGSFNPADLVSSLQATMQRIDLIITQIQQGNTPLAQFVNGDELYTKILGQVVGLQQSIQAVAGPKTPVGQMLFSDAAYNQIRQPILNVDHMLEELQRGENPAGKMLNNPAQYDNAVAQIRKVHQSLSDIDAGKTNGSELLKNDSAYRNIEAQIQKINRSIDELTTGRGKFAQLLQSRALYDSVETQSRTSGTFLREFREEPQRFLRIKLFGKKHPAAKPGAKAPKTP